MLKHRIIQRAEENWKYDGTAARSSKGTVADEWVEHNRELSFRYRNSLEIVKEVYDYAYEFLCDILGEDEIVLPINAAELAEACDFSVSIEDFSSMKKEGDRTYSPVAQLQMRGRKGANEGQIAGTIRIADYLGVKSVNFSIAHELGHYVLREYSPIGLNFLEEACPGMYPLCKTDELLMDLFAYGLLLPYPCFEKLREDYEKDSTRWPIDVSDWIAFLRDKTQMPEYHVVLAYQGIKQYSLAKKMAEVETDTPEWMKNLIHCLLYKLKMTKREVVSVLQLSEAYDGLKQECFLETVEWIQDNKIQENWIENYLHSQNGQEISDVRQQVGGIEEKKGKILAGCPENVRNKILKELYNLGFSKEEIACETGENEKELSDLFEL